MKKESNPFPPDIENLVLKEMKKIWNAEEEEAIKNSMGAYEGKASQVVEMCYSGLSLEIRALIKVLAKLLM